MIEEVNGGRGRWRVVGWQRWAVKGGGSVQRSVRGDGEAERGVGEPLKQGLHTEGG